MASPRTSPTAQAVAATTPIMNEKELSAFLGLSLSTIQTDRIERQMIPFFRIGRSIRYHRERVLEALAKMEHGGPVEMKRRPRKAVAA